jgi:hypothetical protein
MLLVDEIIWLVWRTTLRQQPLDSRVERAAEYALECDTVVLTQPLDALVLVGDGSCLL